MMQGWMDVRVVAGLALLLVVSPAAAADRKAAMERLAANYQQLRQFNGSVLVADEKGVILKKGYGFANAEWQALATPDTKFRIGSITKQFTATLILQLVAEGKVGLDDPLTKYLPDYRKDTGSRVTVTHLLNHTSGIPSYTSNPDFMSKVSRNPYPVAEFVKQFTSGDLEFEPGAKFAYNNSGYFLLGAIIEKVTGKPYAQVLKERIFDPVGMKNTGFDVSATVLPKRASGYDRTPDGYANAPYLDMGLPYSAGSMYSTVEDLYLWDRALYKDTLLPAALKQRMFTPGMNDYAFGWSVRAVNLDDGKTQVATQSHGGGINGFASYLSRAMEKREVVIVLSNVAQSNVQDLASGFLSILHGVEPNPVRRSIGEVLEAVLAKGSATDAIAMYRSLKAQKPAEYKFTAGELNRLGYRLMAQGRLPDAIEIFKLNAEMYPKDWNIYDSLGEAYLANGNKAQAAENYRRSLELAPENTNAVKVLKQLEAPEALGL
ncbi:serine hydrolase [Myxococcaceae bacterium GXIMD 01537]